MTYSCGLDFYLDTNSALRTSIVSWRPYSDTHLEILFSHTEFSHLLLAPEQPGPTSYLQSVECGVSNDASSIWPVEFSIGGIELVVFQLLLVLLMHYVQPFLSEMCTNIS